MAETAAARDESVTEGWPSPKGGPAKAAEFNAAALRVVRERVERLRMLAYADALRIPEASGEDVVVAGREVQLTTFRQAGIASLPGQALVTVQLARFGLGGIASYHVEQGLVFPPTPLRVTPPTKNCA